MTDVAFPDRARGACDHGAKEVGREVPEGEGAVFRTEWVGGPLCGEVIFAPEGTTHVQFDEEYKDTTYRWWVPIEEGRVRWLHRQPAPDHIIHHLSGTEST